MSEKRTLRNIIDGVPVEGVSGVTSDLVNPATGAVFGTAPVSGPEDVDRAMAAAERAFQTWRDTTPSERQRALLRMADAFEEHADELVWAALLDEEGTLRVEDPRVSTTYDGEGRQRRAGLELWLGGDEYPHRGSGEVLCGSTLDLGQLRLDCAFFRWRIDGESGVGRYDVLRRAADA